MIVKSWIYCRQIVDHFHFAVTDKATDGRVAAFLFYISTTTTTSHPADARREFSNKNYYTEFRSRGIDLSL